MLPDQALHMVIITASITRVSLLSKDDDINMADTGDFNKEHMWPNWSIFETQGLNFECNTMRHYDPNLTAMPVLQKQILCPV